MTFNSPVKIGVKKIFYLRFGFRPLSYLPSGNIVILDIYFDLVHIQKNARKKTTKFYAAFLVALTLIIFPIILRNHIISGDIMLRSQTGANIYLGNNPDLKGTNICIEIGTNWGHFISMPHKALNKNATLGESDRYFINETIKTIKKDPVKWAGLIFSKAFTILSGREWLRTEDVYVFNNYILNSPFCLLSTKVIFLFAIIGLIFSFRKPENFSLIYIFLASAAVIIFSLLKPCTLCQLCLLS